MSDLFKREDLVALLRGRTLLLLGGSIMRGHYKDLIWLMNCDTLINRGVLGDKGEIRFPDFESERVSFNNQERKKKLEEIFHSANRDHLHYCGHCVDDFTGLNSGRGYTEVREYFNEDHNIMIIFKFINRVTPTEQRWWTEQIESRLGQRRNIDILLINSALWDINRSSPWAHLDFAGHVDEFIAGVPLSVPNQLCFWLTTPPISEETNSKGMMIEGLEQQNYLTRYNVLNLNKIAAQKFCDRGFQVIDLYYSLQSQIAQRNKDGIHWSPQANRLMTNKILTHISLAIGVKLPGRIESPALERVKSQNKIAPKFGRLVATKVNEKFKQGVSFQVRRQWKQVNEQSKVGSHRNTMGVYSYAKDTHFRTHHPPLDSFEKNFYCNDTQNYQQSPVENLSGLNKGPPQQNLDGFQNNEYNNHPFGPNQGVLPLNPMWLQNNLPLVSPQNFGNSAAYANGSVPHNNVFENVPDILNVQGFQPNHETDYHTDYVNPGPGFFAFDSEPSDFNFHFNGQQMPQPPFGRGHSSGRGRRGRTRSSERRGRGGRGGITNPY